MHQNIHLSAIPPPNRVTASFACDGRSSSLFWSMLPGCAYVHTSHRSVMSEVVLLHCVQEMHLFLTKGTGRVPAC